MLVSGSSIDWYGEGGDSKFELISKHFTDSGLCASPAELNKSLPPAEFDTPAADSPRTANSIGKYSERSDINGVWRWKVEDENSTQDPAGYFTFQDTNSLDNAITGHSIIETQFVRKVAVKIKLSLIL